MALVDDDIPSRTFRNVGHGSPPIPSVTPSRAGSLRSSRSTTSPCVALPPARCATDACVNLPDIFIIVADALDDRPRGFDSRARHSRASPRAAAPHTLALRLMPLVWVGALPLTAGGRDNDPWPELRATTGGAPVPGSLPPGLAFEKVLAAAQEGAGWARTRLYEWLAPAVAGYLKARGAGDPEDLTSEAFVSVFSGCESFSGDAAHFRSWVLRIAHCRLVDARRAQNRRQASETLDSERRTLEDEPAMAPAEDEALRSLDTERMMRVLDALTPDQRNVLALRVIAGLSVKEVAASLDKQPGAVKTLQRRALGALRRKLADEAFGPCAPMIH
ncbi:MAG: RNA polymerase sigma factor [Acidimicrobiales bacterium]